ncbi:MAG: hypothetical protein AABY10_06495, partial [Nanoarchaeota archaeon]
DYDVKGPVVSNAGNLVDVCTKDINVTMNLPGRLLEYYCFSEYRVSRVFYNCTNGCMNGACV